jgi:hypothetical protein
MSNKQEVPTLSPQRQSTTIGQLRIRIRRKIIITRGVIQVPEQGGVGRRKPPFSY